MLKKTQIKNLNMVIFIITFALWSYTDAVLESKGIHGGVLGNIKYLTSFLGIILCIIQLLNDNVKVISPSRIFYKEASRIVLVIIVILLFSLIEALLHYNTKFYFAEMTSELFKMLLPIVYAYLILNTLEFKDIYNSMVFIMFFAIIAYILELGINTFTVSNIMQINFNSSYSPFESHYASGTAIAMCTFFMYYRKNKLLEFISLLFALATFKRAAVLFSLLFWVFPIILDMSKKVQKGSVIFIKLVFVVATYLYYQVFKPGNDTLFERLLGIDANSFTMGRSKYISKIINGNYISTGLGSTTLFVGKSIEMDLIKIMLELSIVGLVIFVWLYFDCAGQTRYGLLYMIFVFFNLLTSHSLTNAFGWILTFVILGTINYVEIVDIAKYKRKKNVKIKLKV